MEERGGDGRGRSPVDGWKRNGRHLFAVRLVGVVGGVGEMREEIASVWADSMSEAVAIAMRRYPGLVAVHGERH